ncbi:MAG: hypothetical protein OJF49_002124 [Ktedonobacterales bacterium]|nr:MAG: hypothetical protein OJF49_002124 [Ktedonobacterales bacterium]
MRYVFYARYVLAPAHAFGAVGFDAPSVPERGSCFQTQPTLPPTQSPTHSNRRVLS